MNLKDFGGTEREIIAETVLYLSELDTRESFREAGYSSLFTFCTERLGYSEGSAYRRVLAAKLLARSPEIYGSLKTGKITLTSLSVVAPIITNENKVEVLTRTEGASKRKAELVALQFQTSAENPKREVIRAKVVQMKSASAPSDSTAGTETQDIEPQERYSFHFEVSKEFHDMYVEARDALGHTKASKVFEKTLREFVGKLRKKKSGPVKAAPIQEEQEDKKSTSPEKSTTNLSRAIPLKTQRAVRARDSNRCTFVGNDGRRCSETKSLEIDHITAWALGGTHEPENLRLCCRAHNQLYAERCFGRKHMQQFKHAGG